MSKWARDVVLDGLLNVIKDSSKEVILSQEPVTYYNACDPATWIASTAYGLDAIAAPTTRNTFVYVCTTAGTSGATEPTWPTVQGSTITDGTAVWTAHENYVLASTPVIDTDFTIVDDATSGRRITLAEFVPITVHTSGTVTHSGLINDTEEVIRVITECSTTLAANDDLTAGGSTIFHEMIVIVRDPTV